MAEHEPFDGLSVVFHSSEVPLSDFHGEAYPNAEDLTLKGEKAYELLVQLNRADKECFERKALGGANFRKAFVDISIPGCTVKRMRLMLGGLQFQSAKTIADALEARLPLSAIKALRSPDYAEAMGMPSAEKCQETIQKTQKAIAPFRKEEDAYLQLHPEIQKINEMQPCSFYTYLASPEAFQKCKDNGLVIDTLHPESLEGCVLLKSIQPSRESEGQAPMRGIDLSHIEQYQEVSPCPLDSKIMFTSAYRPNVMAAALRKEGWQDLRPVITADEAEAIRIMNEKVALEESVAQFENDAENYVSPDQPPKLFKHDAVHGVDAIRDFVNYHLEPKAYTHMPQEVFPRHVDVCLKLGDKALHESYVDSAFLSNPIREAFKNRSITDELGTLKQPFQKAWSVLAKYEDDVVGVPDIYHQWDIKYCPSKWKTWKPPVKN